MGFIFLPGVVIICCIGFPTPVPPRPILLTDFPIPPRLIFLADFPSPPRLIFLANFPIHLKTENLSLKTKLHAFWERIDFDSRVAYLHLMNQRQLRNYLYCNKDSLLTSNIEA